ncbi:hypothetical protein TSUD_382250 [Trifolium subterraneum]|uniref:Uncharacterized protein n=1 Tax=Trifolium subterraneum TaxID=3900 RepID=A0A2Z6NMD9_TRISU|nr:hypothetical protein TSUD_382250 [Trifolium subterraneum]
MPKSISDAKQRISHHVVGKAGGKEWKSMSTTVGDKSFHGRAIEKNEVLISESLFKRGEKELLRNSRCSLQSKQDLSERNRLDSTIICNLGMLRDSKRSWCSAVLPIHSLSLNYIFGCSSLDGN